MRNITHQAPASRLIFVFRAQVEQFCIPLHIFLAGLLPCDEPFSVFSLLFSLSFCNVSVLLMIIWLLSNNTSRETPPNDQKMPGSADDRAVDRAPQV